MDSHNNNKAFSLNADKPHFQTSTARIKKKNYLFLWKTVMIFEFYEQKYLEKVDLKLNLTQSTKQEGSTKTDNFIFIMSYK